jgi:molecular chaperone GrpE
MPEDFEEEVGEPVDAGPPGFPSLDDMAAGGQTSWADVARERDEYLDALRRVQADFDNYRKRVDRQQREMADNAATSLVKKLLLVLDTADLALAHGGGEDVKQVEAALFDVLSKEGLVRHGVVDLGIEGLAHEPVEGDDAPAIPEVSEVLRAGYRWKGRVVRPAMVKVRG